jgi:hypothetical protein
MKFEFFNMLISILQRTVSARPSFKLDNYNLFDKPSSSSIHVKLDLKTSCLNGVNLTLFYCSIKHAIKCHMIVAMVTG